MLTSADAPPSSLQSEHSTPATTSEPLQPPTTKSLDLLTLASLKKVLKPKFKFAERANGVNLFDNLIENRSDTESIAMAHESRVLVPGHSRFMITDLSNFRMLLPGDFFLLIFWFTIYKTASFSNRSTSTICLI